MDDIDWDVGVLPDDGTDAVDAGPQEEFVLAIPAVRAGEFPSVATFKREYRENWSTTLKFKEEGKHAKCPDCSNRV